MKNTLKFKKIALVGFLLISTLLFTFPCSAMFVSESNKVHNPLVTLSLTYVGECGDYVTVDMTPPVPEEVNNSTFSQYVDTQGVIYDNITQFESNYNSYLRYTFKDTDFSDNGGLYEINGGDFFLASNTAFPTITLPQNYSASYEVTIKYRSSKDINQVTKTYNNGYENLRGTVELLNNYVKADIFANDGYIYVEEISYQFVYAPLSSAQVYGLRSGEARDATITDLYGTTWELNSQLTENVSSASYDVSFTSDGDSYNQFSIYLGMSPMDPESFVTVLKYSVAPGDFFEPYYDGWMDDSYRTITFGDGTDSTNSSLIAWLEANGSIVQDTTISDLAGTEWYIPAGWSANSGLGIYYYLYGTVAYKQSSSSAEPTTISIPGDGIAIGYRFVDPVDGFASQADTFAIPYIGNLNPQFDIWLQIVDGEDSTSSSLISWLQANGSLVEDTPTLSAPTLSINDDTLSWTAVNGADSYKIFCNGVRVNTVSAPAVTYVIPVETLYNNDVLVEGVNTFYVVASNQTEDSASSNVVQYTYTAPSTPTEPQDYVTITYCYKQYEGNNSTSYEYFSRLKNEAYSNGYNNGSDATGGIDFSSWIANAVSGFINAELFPGFTLGGVLGIIVAFSVVMLFLKFFAGG